MLNREFEATLSDAFEEARLRRHEYLTVEHLLYAICNDDYGAEILENCGVSIESLLLKLEEFFLKEMEAVPAGGDFKLHQTPPFERLLQRAFMHVQYSGKDEVDAGDILAALFEENDSHAAYFLAELGVSRLDVLNYVSHGIGRDGMNLPDDLQMGDEDEHEEPGKPRSAIEAFTTNLNQRARDGKIDPLIGRGAELRRMIQVLCRRRKNNPLLVGEPGVGKTALAEGLALHIEDAKKLTEGQTARLALPPELKDAEIYSLDLSGMLAGTKFRGEFEQRVKAVIKELQQRPNAILFIDEIHAIVGAGATSESRASCVASARPRTRNTRTTSRRTMASTAASR
jgi:ATP-dependent Clp protease ATP-binding subunit ClpA